MTLLPIQKRTAVLLAGFVSGTDGAGVPHAVVAVNGRHLDTDANGEFEVLVSSDERITARPWAGGCYRRRVRVGARTAARLADGTRVVARQFTLAEGSGR